MCPGEKAGTNPDLFGSALIKKEWDKIEEWLEKEEERLGRSL